MRLKKFSDWVLESAQINKTSIDNTGGYIYSPIGEEEESNYMFFSNLRKINELSNKLLQMDKSKIDDLLNNGHDWANDHVTVAKNNIDQVFSFFNDEQSIKESIENEGGYNRTFSMTTEWWAAWRLENEKEKNLKITKDNFSKTYEVKDKDDKVLFLYDYQRSKVFTNESPSILVLKDDISSDEMKKIEKSADKIVNPDQPKPEKKKDDGLGLDLDLGDDKKDKEDE